ncbi:hypothetical protein IMSAGC015_01336 [Lachnospiraceae bacterium]|nr:hypothetical protein IMSAGC015_01336 [Lachnospiraceae bacterium]
MYSKKEQTIAVFGCSHWHMPLYLESIKKHFVCGISDPDADCRRNLAGLLSCGSYASPEELLSKTRPDFAFCFAPHNEMPELAELMIKNRIPFSMEKPLGTHAGQIESLIQLNKTHHTYCSVPFIWHCSPLLELLKNEIAPEDILHMDFSFIAGPPDRYLGISPWMLHAETSGGGCMTNLGVHFIDLALTLTGTSTADILAARFHYADKDIDIETHAIALLQMGTASVTIETGYSYPMYRSGKRINRWAITTRNGMYIIENGQLEIRIFGKPPRIFSMDTDSDTYYAAYADKCLSDSLYGLPPASGLLSMLNVRKILDHINRKAGEQKI